MAQLRVQLDDTAGMTDEQMNLLADRGVVFMTTTEWGGVSRGGSIIARSEEHAREIAEKRGVGEEIVGTLEAAENVG
ncbi:hypothetical protein JYP52_21410 [Nitratireductor aquibiodomus]|uniref:hypothetical protein n=1 Tax=Nitratireductor TaxID=245876 RepID=UPI000DE0C1D3|nr:MULTISPECIES: hypothetical protein [Nitratireductor]MBN7763700.1 hypothetical protein [Nitratireductor aquibiodomus]